MWSEQFRKKRGSTPIFLILDTEPSLLPGVPGPPSRVSRAVTPGLSLPCVSHRPLLPPGCQNPIRPPGPGAAPPPAGSPAQPLDVPGAVTRESRRSPELRPRRALLGPCSEERWLCFPLSRPASRPSSSRLPTAPFSAVLRDFPKRSGRAERSPLVPGTHCAGL